MGYWGGVWNEIKGSANDIPLLGWLIPDEQPPALPERPPLGIMGKQAAQEQASLYRSLVNQSLMNTIGNINREWGGAGRWSGGGRLKAIENAGLGAMQTVGQLGQGAAMDIYKTNLASDLAYRQLEEQRLWNQAQLDAGQTGTWQSLGQLLPYLIQYLKSQGGA